jgi:hypothetical protein
MEVRWVNRAIFTIKGEPIVPSQTPFNERFRKFSKTNKNLISNAGDI